MLLVWYGVPSGDRQHTLYRLSNIIWFYPLPPPLLPLAGKPHTPAVVPSMSHLPSWNTMAMFVVQPGKSFHSVQVGGGVKGFAWGGGVCGCEGVYVCLGGGGCMW